MSSNSQFESTADGPPPSPGGVRKICFSIEGKEPATVPYSTSDVSGGYLFGGARRTSSDHSSSQAGERDNSGALRGVEDACDGRTLADDRDQGEPRRNDLATEEKMNEFHPLQEFFNCHFLDHVYLQEMLTDLDKLSSYAIRGDLILNRAIVDQLMGLGFQPQYALRHITNQFYAEFVVNNKLDRFLSHVMSDKNKHDVEIFKMKVMKNKNELSRSPKEEGVEEKEDQQGKLSKGGDEVGVSNKRKNADPNFLKILADLVEGMAGLISRKVSPAMAVACVLPKLGITGRPDDNMETNLRFLIEECTSCRMNVKGNKKSRDNVKANIWISEMGTQRTVMIKGSVLNIQKWLQLFLRKLQKVEKGKIAKLIVPSANISEEGKIVKRPSSVFCDKESKQLIRSDESEDWDSIVEVNGSPSEQETQILNYLKVLTRDQQYQRIPLRTSYRGPHN